MFHTRIRIRSSVLNGSPGGNAWPMLAKDPGGKILSAGCPAT
ncbi:hypothetical protein ECFRIK1985_0198 [Escherichia coli FRIK1985]|nr:hypothetical protein ECFRIK1985_0198 [Escherichia coli FRIK1985]EKH60969.1 hypothetical protein ECNE037_0350 [Escherichia coli NE037]